MKMISYHPEAAVQANGIEIVYDAFGERTDPPMLLVMGLGGQLTAWEKGFCQGLAAQGYWVIRYDNRDVGLSTKFDHIPLPDMMQIVGLLLSGGTVAFDYSLYDMAADGIGLLDALGITSAHVVGISMGGMISQIMATRYPERVCTLTSIMSTTNDPSLPPPTAEAMTLLISPTVPDVESYVTNSVNGSKILAGPKYPIDEEKARLIAEQSYCRSYYPVGMVRQLLAVLSCSSRREELKTVTAPTLVVHGDSDPLIPVQAGIDTADHIPNAKLQIIEGMGHGFTAELAPQIIKAIVTHAQ